MRQEHKLSLSDRTYLIAVYQQHSPALFAYLYRHTDSLEDTEDLLLEVFLAALESPGFEQLSERKQEAWLWCVARNKRTDHYRKQRRRRGISLEHVSHEEYDPQENTPEASLLRHEEHERLRASISRLPARQQEIVRLRFGLGLHTAEIANALQKSEGSIRSMLSRALKLLRTTYANGQEE